MLLKTIFIKIIYQPFTEIFFHSLDHSVGIQRYIINVYVDRTFPQTAFYDNVVLYLVGRK